MIIDKMALETGIPKYLIAKIIRTADSRYRTYEIPKRREGVRVISQPSKKLKFVQRWLVKRVLSNYEVHDSATAYEVDRCIIDNARPHLGSSFILKMDFKDFFPSIKYQDIISFLSSNSHLNDLNEEDINYIAQAVTYKGLLTIGAPSSPRISNILLNDFDVVIASECAQVGAVYTRYADDITISSKAYETLQYLERVVKSYLVAMPSPQLRVNEDKTVYVSKRYRRHVTGLVITSDNKISLGRKKKREIKTLIYMKSIGELAADKYSYLMGWLSYANSVEPSFIQSLYDKYGDPYADL